ncbi:MAG: hypothetical protein HQ564_08015 [Candidatus Saganbacteria bacterium]|nr:hypothetical protein [Candidatus Saganbacteria bacterium]
MKRGLIVLALVTLLVFAVVYVVSCGQIQSGGGGASTTLFYTHTANSTPVFTPEAYVQGVLTASSTTEWTTGNPLYSVYFTLREFITSRDEGSVDRSNLYKLLKDVDTVYSGISGEVVTITTQEVTAPFAKLGTLECNTAINDTANKRAAAIKETASTIDAILSWIWTDAGNANKAEYGIATVDYNKSTEDVTVNMTYSVDYDTSTPETSYNMRCYVTGNAGLHSFSFKYLINNTKIVAKGISRGSGNYMLFKYTDGTDPVKYIVVPGDSTENYFITQNGTPSAIYTDAASLPATVASYKDWVVDTDFFSSADLVDSTADLNIGNSKAGTIYLNYN